MPFFTKFATIFPLSSLCNETTLGRGLRWKGLDDRFRNERTNLERVKVVEYRFLRDPLTTLHSLLFVSINRYLSSG